MKAKLVFFFSLSFILGAFRKHLQRYVEFVFLTAPHSVQTSNDEATKNVNTIQRIDDSDTSTETLEVDEDSRSWWFNNEDRTFKGTNKNGPVSFILHTGKTLHILMSSVYSFSWLMS